MGARSAGPQARNSPCKNSLSYTPPPCHPARAVPQPALFDSHTVKIARKSVTHALTGTSRGKGMNNSPKTLGDTV